MPYYRVGKYEFKIEGDAPSEGEIARMQAYLKKNDPDTLAQFPDPSTGYTASQADVLESRVRERFGLTRSKPEPAAQVAAPAPPAPGNGFAARRAQIANAPPSPLDRGFDYLADQARGLITGILNRQPIDASVPQLGLMPHTYPGPGDVAMTESERLRNWRGRGLAPSLMR